MASIAQVDVPEDIKTLVAKVPEEIKTLVEITNQVQYQTAAEQAKTIKGQMDGIDSDFAEPIKKAHEAHKGLIALKNKFWGPRSVALTTLRRLMGKYEQDQEAKRREMERELAAEAKKRQDGQALAEAARLEKEGDFHGASQVLDEALTAPAPVVVAQSQVQKVEGVSYRTNWKFEVVNSSLVPEQYKVVDEQAVGAVVRAMKGNATKLIPGIRVWEERSPVIRG